MPGRLNLRLGVLVLAASFVLADTSIVTLALPDLQRDLSTSVDGVAAVLFVYTALLAVVLPLVARWAHDRRVALTGFLVAGLGSVLCAVSGSLPEVLVGRALQAAGGATGLVAVFVLIGGGGRGRRWWLLASVFAVAAGPALGGALTQAFSWRAIFVVQAPVAGAAAACLWLLPNPPARDAAPPSARTNRDSAPALLALALLSAALSAVLFLLVLLVVAGWDEPPLRAAAAVSVLPVASLVGAQIRLAAMQRAVIGSVLIAGGVLALAWIPQAHLLWIVPPELLAGLGMGMALTALGGELLPERTARDAARLLSVRHAGIAVMLAALAPLIAHQLDVSTQTAKLQGVALVLDAQLPPQSKLSLAPTLLSSVDQGQPRTHLRAAIAAQRGQFHGADLAEYDRLGARADQTLLEAVRRAFRDAFLITGAVGLLAAFALAWGARSAGLATARGRRRALPGFTAAAVLCIATPVAYAAAQHSLAPAPVLVRDPCRGRPLPHTGGLTGVLQDRVLQMLDTSACRLHTSREELVLALADDREARRFAATHHGVDPRSVTSLLGGLLSP